MAFAPDLRVSDADRDETVELLRGHLLAGRLDADEHEERVGDACRARYGRDLEHALRELPVPARTAVPAPTGPPVFVQPVRDGRPGAALTLGLLGFLILLVTGGVGSVVALPLSAAAWGVGSAAARLPASVIGLTGRSTARTGMWLGILGTLGALLAMMSWGLILLG